MLEIPQKPFAAPPPIPVPIARPLGEGAPMAQVRCSSEQSQVRPPPVPGISGNNETTDKVAVASSLCGITAFIPIFSQLIGLALGIWALFRIRRARQAGRQVRGRGWAVGGITGNGFVLLGWIALLGIFATLSTSLNRATKELSPLLKKPPAQHHRVRK